MARCPSCGIENLPSAARCRLCGKDMKPKAPQSDTTRCPHCGSINLGDERTCSVCRRLLSARITAPAERYERDVVFYEKPDISRKPQTRMPLIGGVLLLIIGLGSLGWLVLLTLLSTVAYPEYLEGVSGIIMFGWILVGVMIIGAVAAFKRVWWPIAELGAVSAFFLTIIWLSPFCLVFTGMAFASMLLLFLSRAEFS